MQIKYKLLISSIMITFGLIGSVYLNNTSQKNLSLYKDAQIVIEQINKEILILRKNEKDFIIRGDEKYIKSHKKNIKVVLGRLESLEDISKKANIGLSNDLKFVHTYIERYADIFEEFVEIQNIVNNKVKHGTTKRFRSFLDDFWSYDSTYMDFEVIIFSLYNLEKNFMLTNDMSHIKEYLSIVNLILSDKNLSPDIKLKFRDYKKDVEELVKYKKILGLKEDFGLRGKLRLNIHSTEDILVKMNEKVSSLIKPKIKEIENNHIYETLVLIFLILIVLYFISYDIKKKSQELEEKNHYINNLLNNIPVPIFFKTIDGKYTTINNAFVDFFGYEHSDIIGKTVFDVLPKELAQKYYMYDQELIKKYGKIKQIYTSSLPNKKTNKIVEVIFHKSVIFDLDNKPLGILSAAVDITQLKKVQDKLEELNSQLELKVKEEVEKNIKKELELFENNKLATLGSMIGNIIHQWKQPLNFISLSASTVKFKVDFEEEVPKAYIYKQMDEIIASVNRLSDITTTFRDYLKKDKARKIVDVQDHIEKTLEISKVFLKNKDIDLIKEINIQSPIRTLTVPTELSEVIVNIINNAIDVIDEKDIKNAWIKFILDKSDENTVLISIEDNAGGIPDEVLPHIFDEYFTTKDSEKGTGLGLYMSHKIINESLGGKLYAKNTENGAIFFIEIPISE